jgi:hypothetical protein
VTTMKTGPQTGHDAGLGLCRSAAQPVTLADLSFLSCLERTKLGETWTVRTPAGKKAVCQFLLPHNPETTETLLGRLSKFRHPSLAPWMAVRGDGSRLAVVSPLDGQTLRDRFHELWDGKQPGVPREELLGYLRQVAAALDLLQSRYEVAHLWLHPGQLVILEDRVQILGFGLVETWWAQTERPTADLNPRYSAPELQRKTRAPQCDQYSLALIYAETLTGLHPWRGRAGGGGAGERRGISPPVVRRGLGLLPERDRQIIEQALHRDHRKRFGSATDMIEALEAAANQLASHAARRALAPLALRAPDGLAAAPAIFPCNTFDQFAMELVQLVAGQVKPPDELKYRFAFAPGKHLESAGFLHAADTALPLFDDFCRQWHAQAIPQKDGLVIQAINAAPSAWQWLLGRRMGLEIRVRFLHVPWAGRRVEIVIKPFGCGQEKATQLLAELGPKLLKGVREILQTQPEQRGRERLAVRQRLHVSPVINGAPAEHIECYTKDISTRGIGFFLPVELPASQVYVSLPELASLAPYSALAQVVRKQPNGDGWFEIGASFPVAGRD